MMRNSSAIPLTGASGRMKPPAARLLHLVSYRCPAYRQQVYGSPEDPTTERGDSEDYDVRFSDSSALGADGRLASQPYGSDASARLSSDGSTCISLLDTADSSSSPEVAGGRVFVGSSDGKLYVLDAQTGAKRLIKKYHALAAAVQFPEGAFDIDTPDDYENLMYNFRNER